MFEKVSVKGTGGSLVWAGRPAAFVRTWVATRKRREPCWTLTASLERVDTYRIKQTPLLFEAPRRERPRGLWCFPVVEGSLHVTGEQLVARLHQPEGR